MADVAVSAPGIQALALDDDLHFLVAKVRTKGVAQVNLHLEPFDLKASSYAVLSAASSGRRFSQGTLASFLSLDPSHIVTLVDRLESRGLVERVPDPSDRRTRIVEATAVGRKLDIRARRAVMAAEDAALSALSPEQRESLKHLLKTVADAEGKSGTVQ